MGSGPAWVSAISAVVSLCVVVAQNFREKKRRDADEKERKEKEARVQAERVATWCDVGDRTEGQDKITVTFRNGSELPIYLVTVVLVRLKGKRAERGEDVVANAPALSSKGVFPHMPPGETSKDMHVSPGLEGSRVGVEVAFRDAAGRSWVRRGDGELQSLGTQDPRIGRVFDGSAIAGELYHPEEQ